MDLFELISKIKNTYINNLPNISKMEGLAITIGRSVEYKHGFYGRWFRWICFYDCEYVLTLNEEDMRNYTA